MPERQNIKDVELSMTQKVICGVILALIMWIGATVYSMSIAVAVTSSQVDQLVQNAGDRYTATQAATDKQTMNDRMITLEDRTSRLESKHGL